MLVYDCKITMQLEHLHKVNMIMKDFGFNEQLAPIVVSSILSANRELTQDELEQAKQIMLTTPVEDFVVLDVTIDGAKH